VIGDLAHSRTGGVAPAGVAQVACNKGVRARLIRIGCAEGHSPLPVPDYGTMATIGRNSAVATCSASGSRYRLGWLLCIHLAQLVQFENRLLVFAQWAGIRHIQPPRDSSRTRPAQTARTGQRSDASTDYTDSRRFSERIHL